MTTRFSETPRVPPPPPADLPRLNGGHWPTTAYARTDLPERVLQFGTGMLLRAVCAAAVDAANRAGAFRGRIVVVQSTPQGRAGVINAQDGLFTLAERGMRNGAPVDRTLLVGSISRALVADTEWEMVREVASRPELQVIVSNVTEAGFRPDASFPARLTDLLHTRFERLPHGPAVFVIPTELVPDNGTRLAEMVDLLSSRFERADEFREWVSRHVRFCSSLVDRITTGAPAPDARTELESRLGFTDALLTVTEPYCLWAIESDPPPALRGAFAIDVAPEVVTFASDIGFYEERKLRLLNGAHTAMAPLALLGGVPTVREAAEHARLGALLRRMLFEEIVPGTDLPPDAAESFAGAVLDRFKNPWLAHEWRVIATNQTAKMRVRVVPSIAGFMRKRGRVPEGLALACAAHLRYLRPVGEHSASEGRGWWRGATYPIVDADLSLIARHWRAVEPDPGAGSVPADTLARLAARALADDALWGAKLSGLPGLLENTTRRLQALERDGVEAAVS